jgi:hypothetical protein
MKAAITGARPKEILARLESTSSLFSSKVVTNAFETTITKAPLKMMSVLESAARYDACASEKLPAKICHYAIELPNGVFLLEYKE